MAEAQSSACMAQSQIVNSMIGPQLLSIMVGIQLLHTIVGPLLLNTMVGTQLNLFQNLQNEERDTVLKKDEICETYVYESIQSSD